jgi:hypothetical protein
MRHQPVEGLLLPCIVLAIELISLLDLESNLHLWRNPMQCAMLRPWLAKVKAYLAEATEHAIF